MKTLFTAIFLVTGISLGGAPAARAASYGLYPPAADIVLTDPMVRSVQIGDTPVGQIIRMDARTGSVLVALPGIGVRYARLLGTPIAGAGRPAVRAVDLETGVEFVALLPSQPRLVPATVVAADGDVLLIRRQSGRITVTDAVPVGSVFARYGSSYTPALRVTGALRRGAQVYVPDETEPVARVIVRH
jgi:hypothetical protein